MFTKFLETIGFAVVIVFLPVLSTFAQDVPVLEIGRPLQFDIKGGETRRVTVAIGAGQTADVEVEQRGVDVSLAAFRPNGERFVAAESPSGLTGRDWILVPADVAGVYAVEITPADPRAAAGKFTIVLKETRPTTPRDAEINDAAARLTKIADETVALRQRATREARREVIEKFREILRLSKVKEDPAWEVIGVVTIGLIYEQLGEIQNALDFYRQGLALARAAGLKQYEGTSLNNLAVNYNVLGEFDRAIFYLQQALALQRETGNKRGEAINLNNLGMSHLLRGDLASARAFFEQSLPLRREVGDERGEATTLNNIGNVLVRIGDHLAGREMMTRALALRRKIGDRGGEAISLRNLAHSNRLSGDSTTAAEFYQQSNKLAAELGDRRLEAETAYGLAILARDAGDLAGAAERVSNAIRIVEQIRGELVSQELRTAYFSTIQDYYELYADVLVARHRKDGNAADLAASLEVSERARARSLVELLQEARVDIRRGVDPKLAELERDRQDALNLKYRQRTQLLAGKPSPEQVAKLETEIRSISDELDALRVRIKKESPRYASLGMPSAPSLDEIRTHLVQDDTVLVEYKLGDRRSFMWTVAKNSLKVYELPSRREIEAAATAYFAAVSKRGNMAASATAAKNLDFLLPASARAEIGSRRIAIVADGVIQFIPFAALGFGGAELVETNEIVVLPSVAALAEIRRLGAPLRPDGDNIAVFADAVFDRSDPRLGGRAATTAATRGEDDLVSKPDTGGLRRLLASRSEARAITALAPEKTVANLDFDANRDLAMSDDLGRFSMIHFATHGVLDATRPDFSGLVLSLYDRNGKPVDGFLRLAEIYNLNLNSDLVVLSACRTALGKDVRGEGLVGLTRGFFYAGARRVVASLWQVDDAATAELMKRFYGHLLKDKMQTAAALRVAQRELKAIPRFRDPYFWAGFTMQGEWR